MIQVIVGVRKTCSIDDIYLQLPKGRQTKKSAKRGNEKARKSQKGPKRTNYSTECTEMHLRGAVEFQVSLVHVSGRKRILLFCLLPLSSVTQEPIQSSLLSLLTLHLQ
jgi:hypothetical protein